MNLSVKQLEKLAGDFCKKIKPGKLHGESKTVISMEIGNFLRFVKKSAPTPTLYMVAVDKNSLDQKDQRVDGFLGFSNKDKVMKICLYSRGEAIKKARIFRGKAVKFKGKPNKRKHYFV